MAGFLGWLLKLLTGPAVDKVLGYLEKKAGSETERERIRTQVTIAEINAAVEQNRVMADLQKSKMNWPVFWVLIVAMMGPPIILLWSVGIYNILWWEHGIWPQSWSIADFPPSVKPWAQAAVDWLYDPLGPPSGIGAALVAGRFTRR